MVLISDDVIHTSGSQKIATKVSSSCILQFSIQERERAESATSYVKIMKIGRISCAQLKLTKECLFFKNPYILMSTRCTFEDTANL